MPQTKWKSSKRWGSRHYPTSTPARLSSTNLNLSSIQEKSDGGSSTGSSYRDDLNNSGLLSESVGDAAGGGGGGAAVGESQSRGSSGHASEHDVNDGQNQDVGLGMKSDILNIIEENDALVASNSSYTPSKEASFDPMDTTIPNDVVEMEQPKSDDNDDDDDEDASTNEPIIYTNQQEDDDISQITSSIAGNSLYSFYSHEYMFGSSTNNPSSSAGAGGASSSSKPPNLLHTTTSTDVIDRTNTIPTIQESHSTVYSHPNTSVDSSMPSPSSRKEDGSNNSEVKSPDGSAINETMIDTIVQDELGLTNANDEIQSPISVDQHHDTSMSKNESSEQQPSAANSNIIPPSAPILYENLDDACNATFIDSESVIEQKVGHVLGNEEESISKVIFDKKQDDDDVINIYALNERTKEGSPFSPSRLRRNISEGDDLTLMEMYSTCTTNPSSSSTNTSIHSADYNNSNTCGTAGGYFNKFSSYSSDYTSTNPTSSYVTLNYASGRLGKVLYKCQSTVKLLTLSTRQLLRNATSRAMGNNPSMHKKDDDIRVNEQEEEPMDYLSMILSSSTFLPQSSSSSSSPPSSSNNHKEDFLQFQKEIRAKKVMWIKLFTIMLLVCFLLISGIVENDNKFRKKNQGMSPVRQGQQSQQQQQQQKIPYGTQRTGIRGGYSDQSAMMGNVHAINDMAINNNQKREIEQNNMSNEEVILPDKVGTTLVEPIVDANIPPALNNFVDIQDGVFDSSVGDIPFFWHVPRSAGATMNDIMGECLNLRIASNAGSMGGHGQDSTLQVVKFDKQPIKYVNVDVSTTEGIERAKVLNLASSELADVVVSSLFHESSSMFSQYNRGRVFTVLRHPVERSISLFFFLRDTQWKVPGPTYDEKLANITPEAYYHNNLNQERNWLTRFLTGQITKGEVDDTDLALAKEILRRKVLVGLLSEKGESFARFQRYFNWNTKRKKDAECLEQKLDWDWPLRNIHGTIEEGSGLWNLISSHNSYDMQLYEYAQLLFQDQKNLFQK